MSKLQEAYKTLSAGFALLAEAVVAEGAASEAPAATPAKGKAAAAPAATPAKGKAKAAKTLTHAEVRERLQVIIDEYGLPDAQAITKKYAPKFMEIEASDLPAVREEVEAYLAEKAEKPASNDNDDI